MQISHKLPIGALVIAIVPAAIVGLISLWTASMDTGSSRRPGIVAVRADGHPRTALGDPQ